MTTPATPATPFQTFNSYDRAADATAIYPESGMGTMPALTYAVLGLTNEAGEVAGKLKKILRDSNGHLTQEAKKAIAAEAADTLWYLSRVAIECDTTLQDLATQNAAKLADRKNRGVLGGSGDNR